jgi:hypothetical protein
MPRRGSSLGVHGISTQGRYVVTSHRCDRLKGAGARDDIIIQVWDKETQFEQPVISKTVSGTIKITLTQFDADEKKLAIVFHDKNGNRNGVLLWDLTHPHEVEREFDAHYLIFSREGELLYVQDFIVSHSTTKDKLGEIPTAIDGFRFSGVVRDFAIYRRDDQIQVRNLLTREIQNCFALPGNLMIVNESSQISIDAKVLLVLTFPDQPVVNSADDRWIILEADTNTRIALTPQMEVLAMSPDGCYVALLPKSSLFLDESDSSCKITHCKEERAVVRFRDVQDARFSQGGNYLAILTKEGTVSIYSFPFTSHWGLIAAESMAVGLISFVVIYVVRFLFQKIWPNREVRRSP